METKLNLPCSISYLEQWGVVLSTQLAVAELDKLGNTTKAARPCGWFEDNLACSKNVLPKVLDYIAKNYAYVCPLCNRS